MFRWEPEGRYRCNKSMAIAPFWFSTELCWALAPFWLSANDMGMTVTFDTKGPLVCYLSLQVQVYLTTHSLWIQGLIKAFVICPYPQSHLFSQSDLLPGSKVA